MPFTVRSLTIILRVKSDSPYCLNFDASNRPHCNVLNVESCEHLAASDVLKTFWQKIRSLFHFEICI
jgi:hypothetical protein